MAKKPLPKDLPKYRIFNGLKMKRWTFTYETRKAAEQRVKELKQHHGNTFHYRIVKMPSTGGDWSIFIHDKG